MVSPYRGDRGQLLMTKRQGFLTPFRLQLALYYFWSTYKYSANLD